MYIYIVKYEKYVSGNSCYEEPRKLKLSKTGSNSMSYDKQMPESKINQYIIESLVYMS